MKITRKHFIAWMSIAIFACSAFTILTKKNITIWMIGDSTMAIKQAKAYPETGWGMEVQPFFDNTVQIENKAMNGRSTKSFINEKRWQEVLDNLKEGDYVLIEFGHNDEKIEKPAVGTSLDEFRGNLAKFINESKDKKAIPVLMTPICRRNFKNGVLIDTHKGYPDVVRKLAGSLHVPLVDMQQKTEQLLTSLGDEGSKFLFNYVEPGNVNYPEGKKDDTHLSPTGAKKIAGLAVEALKELVPGIAGRLK
ncbi:MAG: rhamnogalacturonan acetylesterase [Ferruginibacter sp.]|nr:rhamnogalacturonan acetylesterase [Ferruginibacter sp.]